ncbi:MAG: hypothetical protein Fur0010_06310 [Bdellovibrio sp.]
MKRSLATFVFLGLFFGNTAMALDLSFEQLNLQYSGANGRLEAASIDYTSESVEIKLDDEVLDLVKEEGKISALKEGLKASLLLKDQNILDSVSFIELTDAQGRFAPGQTLALKTSHVAFELGNGIQTFNNITLSCEKFSSLTSVDLNWISPCQDQGFFSIPELRLDKNSVSTVGKALGVNLSIDKLKDIQLVVSNKRFMLGFEAKYLFNWKVKATGTLVVNTDENQVEMNIISAKAGIFNIKSKLLKEIQDSNIKNIKVSGDTIIISL